MGRGSLDFDNVPPHEVHAVRTLSDPTYGMLVTIPYREPEGWSGRSNELGANSMSGQGAVKGAGCKPKGLKDWAVKIKPVLV